MSTSAWFFSCVTDYRGRRENYRSQFALPAGLRSSATRLIRKADRRRAAMDLARELPTVEDLALVYELQNRDVNGKEQVLVVAPKPMSLAEAQEYLTGTKHLKLRGRSRRPGYHAF